MDKTSWDPEMEQPLGLHLGQMELSSVELKETPMVQKTERRMESLLA